MPEIAEVARVVHFIRKTLVGKTLQVVKAQDDANVFGKAGTSASEFETAIAGKKVINADQQGKYFWMVMSSPPHPLFHFGMTGWFYIRGEPTILYRTLPSDSAEIWPPKFWKFRLETAGTTKVEAAFADARRFGRVRLLNCDKDEIRKVSPLKENGPDPIIDSDIVTESWLATKLAKKRVPIKAFLLNQANISGIGNWVSDEILYQAKIHPEQYTNTLTSENLKLLYKSMSDVCHTAVDLLADSSKFPEHWLFNYRWGKGKKDAATTLPSGARISFVTVGGRTSCVVPIVQVITKTTNSESIQAGNGTVNKKRKLIGATESLDYEESLLDNDQISSDTEKHTKQKSRRTKALPKHVSNLKDTDSKRRCTTVSSSNEGNESSKQVCSTKIYGARRSHRLANIEP